MDLQKEAKKLFRNRLMRSEEEIENFEEAMNSIYSENNIENIKYYCQAFDDKTENRAVMFSMIHGIEAYDQIFGANEATKKFLESIHLMNERAQEWLEIMILRILNDDISRNVMIYQVKLGNVTYQNLQILKRLIVNLTKRNPDKFGVTGGEVLSVF